MNREDGKVGGRQGRRRPSFCSHEWLIIHSVLATLRYGKAGCRRRIVVIVYRARSTWVALVSRRLLPILGRLRRLRRASRKYGKKKGHLRGGLAPWGSGNRGAHFQSPLGAGRGGGTSRAETLSPPLRRTCGRAPKTDLGVSTYGRIASRRPVIPNHGRMFITGALRPTRTRLLGRTPI